MDTDHIHLDLSQDEQRFAAQLAKQEHKTLEEFVSDCVRAYVNSKPNQTTLETFAKTDTGAELNTYGSADELFSKFGI